MFKKYKNHILLHLIIFMWGFTGILGKLINLESIYIVWYRVVIAFIVLVFIFLFFKKELKLKSKSHFFKLMGVGCLVALHWLTFYIAIQLSTASFGVLCLATTTFHVAWLEPLVMKRPFSWVEIGLSIIVVFGIYFVSADFSAEESLALLFGLASALFAALFSVFNAKLVQDIKPLKITLYEMFAASIFMTVVMFFQGKMSSAIFDVNISDILWLLFLGSLCTAFAFFAIVDVVKQLGAYTVSLSINLEPIYTFFLAIFILSEHKELSSTFYFGSLLIIAVVALNAFIKSQMKKKRLKLNKSID